MCVRVCPTGRLLAMFPPRFWFLLCRCFALVRSGKRINGRILAASIFFGTQDKQMRETWLDWHVGVFQVVQLIKNLAPNAGDERDAGSIPGSGRSPGEGNGNPLQYYCLENSLGRGAWQATVNGVAKSQTWLKQLSMHVHTHARSSHPGQPLWKWLGNLPWA